MEPQRNSRVTRSLRRTFYSFSRRYGESLYLYKVADSSTDYTTGNRTRTYTRTFVRNAVHVPNQTTRSVSYTPAMMQAIRQFAWQGGAGQDFDVTAFLIADRDIRGWCDVDQTQFIGWQGGWYQVENVNEFEGGVVVQCKQAKGSGPALWQNHDSWNNCLNWIS